jgi:hypothetical protein
LEEAANFGVGANAFDASNFALVKADEATRIPDEPSSTDFAILTEIATGFVGDEILEKRKSEVKPAFDEPVMESE